MHARPYGVINIVLTVISICGCYKYALHPCRCELTFWILDGDIIAINLDMPHLVIASLLCLAFELEINRSKLTLCFCFCLICTQLCTIWLRSITQVSRLELLCCRYIVPFVAIAASAILLKVLTACSSFCMLFFIPPTGY